MSVYAKEVSSAPALMERQLLQPLRWRELENALRYGLWHLSEREIKVDSRWLVEQTLTRQRRRQQAGNTQEQQVRQLVEMLGQMGFEIDLDVDRAPPTREQVEKELAYQQQATFSELPRFLPRKEPYLLSVGERNYDLYVWPISARPNLKRLDLEALRRLFPEIGLPRGAADRLAAALVDWRDPDTTALPGSRDGMFRYADAYYNAPGPDWTDWGHLAFLAGAGPDLIDELRRHFVIHGSEGRVHPDYVSPQVIAAIADLPLEVVQKGLDHLREGDEATLALSEVIGDDAAQALRSVLTKRVAESSLYLVRVAGGGHSIEAVADADGRLLDWWRP